MRDRLRLMAALLPVLLLSLTIFAAVAQPAPQGPGNAGPTAGQFDPHDLSGIWLRNGGDRGFGRMPPALTPAGEARLKTTVPARSRNPLAKASDKPSDSNDPTMDCNPHGFPRLLLDTAHDYHEMIMTPGRILQLWQKERRPREIWTDGRAVPSGKTLDNLGPAWYGHSVGVWQGDTLVVTTVGLEDRAWLDGFGFPKSFDAKIEERYRRVDAETLELQLTLTDPTYYKAPWISDKKVWKKQKREDVTWYGWYGLFSGIGELTCAPMNANRVNKRGG